MPIVSRCWATLSWSSRAIRLRSSLSSRRRPACSSRRSVPSSSELRRSSSAARRSFSWNSEALCRATPAWLASVTRIDTIARARLDISRAAPPRAPRRARPGPASEPPPLRTARRRDCAGPRHGPRTSTGRWAASVRSASAASIRGGASQRWTTPWLGVDDHPGQLTPHAQAREHHRGPAGVEMVGGRLDHGVAHGDPARPARRTAPRRSARASRSCGPAEPICRARRRRSSASRSGRRSGARAPAGRRRAPLSRRRCRCGGHRPR